jgi:hypothetical protein
MNEQLEFLIKDNQCYSAIDAFKETTSIKGWLNQYVELYNAVTIKPDGLPSITSSHFDGEAYENIQKFAHLYELINSLFETSADE